jgi:hypothetical protein
MKRILNILLCGALILSSCKEDEINVFEKTADERAAEAIAALKQDLVSAPAGWKLKYQPVNESGAFYVLMDFEDDNSVNIKTDFAENEGEYHDQTITYRIDNSLGLELILESGSFFSFLYDMNQGNFAAEFEFDFVNKNENNALVFKSKTDAGNDGTTLLLEHASPGDINLLGTTLATNLNKISDDIGNLAPGFALSYSEKNLLFFLSIDDVVRTLTITAVAETDNTQSIQEINFNTTYFIQGDLLVFDDPFTGNFFGNSISIENLKLNSISDATLDVCSLTKSIQVLSGVTSSGDAVNLQATLTDLRGNDFTTTSDFFVAPLSNILNNGEYAGDQVAQDISGASSMQLYYNYEGDSFYAIGFFLENLDGSTTWALREFTPVITNNNIVFQFAPDITVFGNETPDATVENVNIYLNALTQGDQTFVFRFNDNAYEFYNPCTGWSVVFLNAR